MPQVVQANGWQARFFVNALKGVGDVLGVDLAAVFAGEPP
jgi:hypothetical protein